jgi:hypothetical protein
MFKDFFIVIITMEQTKSRKEINKTYYDNNKDKLVANLLKKVKCECGSEVSYAYMHKHKKSGTHFKHLAGF